MQGWRACSNSNGDALSMSCQLLQKDGRYRLPTLYGKCAVPNRGRAVNIGEHT